MKRRSLLAAPLALAFAGAAAAQTRPQAQPASAPAIDILEGEARAAALAAANRALNGVSRLQGRFVQRAPDGRLAAGAFYLQRPGKLRFEYDPPASMLIISDGNVVHLRDTALRTTERTPLRSTPLNLILAANVDLDRQARVLRVSRSGLWTMITARDRTGEMDGQVMLHFYGDGAELRSWDVIDAAGGRTRITLSDITRPASLDRGLFRPDDILENRPGRRP